MSYTNNTDSEAETQLENVKALKRPFQVNIYIQQMTLSHYSIRLFFPQTNDDLYGLLLN